MIFEADRLLREKYDPSRATVTSFLSSFLPSRVTYRLIRGIGKRYRNGTWISEQDLLRDNRIHKPTNPDFVAEVDLEDLVEACHPDTRPIFRELLAGKTVDEIALEEVAGQTFESGRKRAAALRERRVELQQILAIEWRRLTR